MFMHSNVYISIIISIKNVKKVQENEINRKEAQNHFDLQRNLCVKRYSVLIVELQILALSFLEILP
jgi:hypothetical protein